MDSEVVVDFLFGWDRKGGAAFLPELGEGGDERVEHSGAQGEEVEFALAGHVDEARGFEFLDVVGESRRGNGEGRAHHRTAERA